MNRTNQDRVVVIFVKDVIDSKFANATNIKAFYSMNGKKWKSEPLVIKVILTYYDEDKDIGVYYMKLPKTKRLKSCLIAFGDIENDGNIFVQL